MDASEESLRPIAWRLRDLIIELHPDASKVVRLGDGAATYGFGPMKMTEGYVYIMPHSHWINLGFYHGASLPDHDRLLEGTGVSMRHVKVRDMANGDMPAIRRLVESARNERFRALGPD